MVSVMKLAKKGKCLSNLKPRCPHQFVGVSHEHPSTATPVGFLPVYIGEERQRFVIPMSFLSHPLFRMLLEKAYREYGFKQSRGLMLPCNASIFQEVMSAVECSHGQFDLEKLVEELI